MAEWFKRNFFWMIAALAIGAGLAFWTIAIFVLVHFARRFW